jgi:hypothetical protein
LFKKWNTIFNSYSPLHITFGISLIVSASMGSTTMGISVCRVGHRLLCIHNLMAILVKYTMTNFGYYGYSFSLLYVLFNTLTVIIGTIF